MNPKIKARWLEALRSGKYQQGQFYLNLNNKFCCLGVLCDLAAQEGIVKAKGLDDLSEEEINEVELFSGSDYEKRATFYVPDNLFGVRYTISHEVLPTAVRKWAGLDANNPSVGGTLYETLAELNDNSHSFRFIANIIEKNF